MLNPNPQPEHLQKRLEATHLPTTADIKAELETANTEAQTKTPDLNADPRAKAEYVFEYNYTDARGKTWEGKFTHQVPTLAQRDIIDAMQARKKLNMPVESFSAMAAERHLCISHLEVCLTKRPKWAENLDGLYDPMIIEGLYAEAASHEAYFLGWGTSAGSGEGQRSDGDGDAA